MQPLPSPREFPLTDVHRMLLQIRDTLYEGSWEDFIADLKFRARAGPYVFETIPDSPEMQKTIQLHLAMIEDMRKWEAETGTPLRSA